MKDRVREARESEKALFEKEKIKLETSLKEELSRKFRDAKEAEILQLRETFEQEIEEQNNLHLQNEQTLQNQVQQKDKLIKQLKLEHQKALTEKEQSHRSRVSQMEEEYMVQIDQLREEIDEQKRQKDLQAVQHSKELGSQKTQTLRHQETLQKTITSLESQALDLTERLAFQESLTKELQTDGSSKNSSMQQQIEKLKTQVKKDEKLLQHQEKEIEVLKGQI